MLPLLSALAVLLAGCGGDVGSGGRIQIDGSSTVYPLTQAMAEEFMLHEGRDVRVTVAQSGTGGGFARFCDGEVDINDASRPIQAAEAARCAANGVEPVEFEVAKDGITVAVNPESAFVDCLTVAELRRIWEPGSTVRMWSDVRSEWPNREIKLYGPGPDSGTFDYFTERVMGEEDASRQDYTASEDDNVLVQGVAGDPGALGYFGYAYYAENADRVKALAVDGGAGCVEPTPETISSGEYSPLTRPVLIYVSREAIRRTAVLRFLEFYMGVAEELVPQVGYLPLPGSAYEANLERARSLADD
jgi:phosphate transport system substrate-binding protein